MNNKYYKFIFEDKESRKVIYDILNGELNDEKFTLSLTETKNNNYIILIENKKCESANSENIDFQRLSSVEVNIINNHNEIKRNFISKILNYFI